MNKPHSVNFKSSKASWSSIFGLLLGLALLAPSYAEAAYRFIDPVGQFQDSVGVPLASGTLTFYKTATLTLKDTYTTEALSTPNANPVTLSAAGRPNSEIWLDGRYRVILKDADGNTVWDRDPIEDAVTASDLQDGSTTWAGVATGTANAITLTLTPAITAYADGMAIRFRVATDNTSAVTANANSVGAKSVVKADATALIAGDLQANDTVTVVYDSTNNRFQLHSANAALARNGNNTPARADVASAATVDLDAAATSYVRVTGTTTITAITLADGRLRHVVFGDALTLTNGASLILPGAANIQTAAGDTATFIGEAAGVVRVSAYESSEKKTNYQTFTASGTWTKPSKFEPNSLVVLEGWGGGGGGNSAASAAGGGGGAYVRRELRLSELGATETITVGAGGGVAAAGTNTTIGTLLTAYAGGFGNNGASATGGGGGGSRGIGANGGVGGLGYSAIAAAVASANGVFDGGGGGGNGGTTTDYGGSSTWGGGGGAGSDSGGSVTGGFSLYGGGGGGGGGGASTGGGTSRYGGNGGASGVAGTAPGGGGGRNAAGARGEVRITVLGGR